MNKKIVGFICSTLLFDVFSFNDCYLMNSRFFSKYPNPTMIKKSQVRLYYSPQNIPNLDSTKLNYPFSKKYYQDYLKRLNSKNITIQTNSIMGLDEHSYNNYYNINPNSTIEKPKIRIILNKSNLLESLGLNIQNSDSFESDEPIQLFNKQNEQNNDEDDYDDVDKRYRRQYSSKKENLKSKNFQVIQDFPIQFKDIGGYQNVKDELYQSIDILSNFEKYRKYNVRIPKGIIFEGPPGNGKTLLAKGLAGESKYVGVGSSRIKELFELAKKNVPCIIFIDEIDALGRKRSGDGESSSNERDNTLNALLIELDGFKNNTGIFVVGATNRIDLLDSALIRPGRIDKKIYIGLPDQKTREAIIRIHIDGKPHDDTIQIDELVEITDGCSGAQIENLLNEAMLNALRYNSEYFTYSDFDLVLNKMMVGWQPMEHEFSENIIDHIAIHEMGHAIVGILSKHHSKVSKVMINLYSPRTPGYTIFEASSTSINIRESLFEHLMILLAGRIAEEVFYEVSVSTGAINDFEEALKLAERMVLYYGMGSYLIYPKTSEKYKEMIDNDVDSLIKDAYNCARLIIDNCKVLIQETSEILKKNKILKAEEIIDLINNKYSEIWDLKI